jgi:DNA-binding protein YbaB
MKTTQVSIDETLLSGNKDIIENAIKVATNEALDKAKDTASKRLKSVTGGLMDNFPGF